MQDYHIFKEVLYRVGCHKETKMCVVLNKHHPILGLELGAGMSIEGINCMVLKLGFN